MAQLQWQGHVIPLSKLFCELDFYWEMVGGALKYSEKKIKIFHLSDGHPD